MNATEKSTDHYTSFAKRISANMPISVQRTNSAERFQGILVGNIRTDKLLLAGIENARLAANEKIVLRMALGNHIVGFETTITNMFESPYLCVVNFPNSIETVNLRKVNRVPAYFPADVQLVKHMEGQRELMTVKTRIIDIGVGGCAIRSKARLPSNQDVGVSFTLPGDPYVHSLKGRVLECQNCGMAFHNRFKFNQDPTSMPILKEVNRWVNDNMGFFGDW